MASTDVSARPASSISAMMAARRSRRSKLDEFAKDFASIKGRLKDIKLEEQYDRQLKKQQAEEEKQQHGIRRTTSQGPSPSGISRDRERRIMAYEPPRLRCEASQAPSQAIGSTAFTSCSRQAAHSSAGVHHNRSNSFSPSVGRGVPRSLSSSDSVPDGLRASFGSKLQGSDAAWQSPAQVAMLTAPHERPASSGGMPTRSGSFSRTNSFSVEPTGASSASPSWQQGATRQAIPRSNSSSAGEYTPGPHWAGESTGIHSDARNGASPRMDGSPRRPYRSHGHQSRDLYPEHFTRPSAGSCYQSPTEALPALESRKVSSWRSGASARGPSSSVAARSYASLQTKYASPPLTWSQAPAEEIGGLSLSENTRTLSEENRGSGEGGVRDGMKREEALSRIGSGYWTRERLRMLGIEDT